MQRRKVLASSIATTAAAFAAPMSALNAAQGMAKEKGRVPVRFVAWVTLKNGKRVTAKELGVRGIPIYGSGRPAKPNA